ncbi:MAG: type II secretion system protein GspG, partial [Candidatus Brocadiales bacterium]|nr:type II secretion system protein GspG [Candidatus Brocadiales bacterium]
PKDPWGNEYIYTYPGANGDYDIVSYGADGNTGGDDEDKDVASWE